MILAASQIRNMTEAVKLVSDIARNDPTWNNLNWTVGFAYSILLHVTCIHKNPLNVPWNFSENLATAGASHRCSAARACGNVSEAVGSWVKR